MPRLWIAIVLLFAASQAVQAATPPFPGRVALIIGNNRYDPTAGPLKNCVNDARAMAETLRGLGFEVTLKENLRREPLLEELLKFRSSLAAKEVALFYFAGYGISVSGSNYLLPLDSGYDPTGADETTLRLLAETKLFNVDQAVADLKSGGAKCNLIILDACRTTALARNVRTRQAGAASGGLSEMTPPAGSLIAFATDAGQTALDGEGSHGLYTEELLRHLKEPGLTIEQVFKRTRASVLERSGGQQIPAEYSRLVGEDIYLAGKIAAQTLTQAETNAPSVPSSVSIPRMVKAVPVPAPSLKRILQMAEKNQVEETLQALADSTKTKGAQSGHAEALQQLLDHVRESLKAESPPLPDLKTAQQTCERILTLLPLAVPSTDPQYETLTAKAQNRRGDALLALGRADEALEAYEEAYAHTPEDAYILYNRARAHLALGNTEAAKRDLVSASDPKLRQPKARDLAQTLLRTLP